jgi:hypothetical protein
LLGCSLQAMFHNYGTHFDTGALTFKDCGCRERE